MKKVWITLVVFVLLGVTVVTTSAAKPNSEPFTGTFTGMIEGDNNTSAPITLKLEQDGNNVIGTAFLGKGLYVDAGNCGGAYIPASTQTTTGTISAKNPDLLASKMKVNVGGFNVTINLAGELDDDILDAQAKVDLPWLCGTDPVLTSQLEKTS